MCTCTCMYMYMFVYVWCDYSEDIVTWMYSAHRSTGYFVMFIIIIIIMNEFDMIVTCTYSYIFKETTPLIKLHIHQVPTVDKTLYTQ